MDASKRSTSSLPDVPASSPSGKGIRNYLQHLAHIARTTRFGNREVQLAGKLNAIQQANNQLVQATLAAHPTPAELARQTAAMPADWISNLLHQEITGVTPLLKAINEGNHEFAMILLKNGALANTTIQIPLNESDPNIAPLFKQASFTSQESMNQCITDFASHLFNKAPKSQIRDIGANALTLAILRGADHAFINELISTAQTQDKFILDRPDGSGRTALCMAVENNDAPLIMLLLRAGANPSTRNGKQQSPLLLAASHSHTACMIALLKAGAEPDMKASVFLDRCYEKKNADAFIAYQALSLAHRKDVLKYVKKKSDIVLRGTEQDLQDYLAITQSMITDKRLAKLAITAANQPDSFTRVMIIAAAMQGTFNDAQCKALRVAAAQSENSAIFEYAAKNDALLGMLESDSVYLDDDEQSQLNEELALALKAHSVMWVNKLFSFGACLDISLDSSTPYPTLAQLADLGDARLIDAFLEEHPVLEDAEKWHLPDRIPPFLDSVLKVHTIDGCRLLLDKSNHIMDRLDETFKYALLMKAAGLGSRELVERLVEAGAELNYNTRIFKALRNHHHLTPISNAMEAGNHDMVSTLLELGVVPSAYDLSRRHTCPKPVAEAMLQAQADFLNDKQKI